MSGFLRTLLAPHGPWHGTRVLSDVERVAMWERRRGEYREQKVLEHESRRQNFDHHAASRVRPLSVTPRLPREIADEIPWVAL